MLASRIHEWAAEPQVEEVPDPEPADAESLVEIAAASVAHIDLTVASGSFRFRPTLPHVPGTEGAGRVAASATFPEGTPVRIRGGGVGLTRDGTWAELAAVPDVALEPLDEDADLLHAAVFFSPCVTAHLAVVEIGRVRPGERVAVRGAGGAVGAVAVQLALEAGAEVVGLEASSERAAAIPAGATALVDADALEDVDVLIDTAGGPKLARIVTRAMRPGGRAVLVGYADGTDVTFRLPELLAADVSLLPVNLIRAERRMGEAARGLLARLGRGELEVPVTAFPLAEAARAVEALRERRVPGKVALRP